MIAITTSTVSRAFGKLLAIVLLAVVFGIALAVSTHHKAEIARNQTAEQFASGFQSYRSKAISGEHSVFLYAPVTFFMMLPLFGVYELGGAVTHFIVKNLFAPNVSQDAGPATQIPPNPS
ncbi:MAG TPA: hypothetical protein VFV19_06910 [Candidatus Polarisedimenticolaceae bacterium]|nr:hypothetical protein [Candidatus Polarisedimenticolaceae bacterium]